MNGEVYFNNKHLKNNKDLITSNVAYLPQEVFLIDDTITKNITMGLPYTDEKNVIDVLKDVKLWFCSYRGQA